MSRKVYGLHPVEELLRSKRDVAALFVVEGDRPGPTAKLRDVARARHIAVVPRSRPALDALADGMPHQGVVAITGDFVYVEPATLLDQATARLEIPLLLVLDSVQDPQNLGALVRSAHVLGAHGVIVPKDRSAPITAAVVKASAGATEHLPIARSTNLARTLEELKAAGVWTVGAVAGDQGAAVAPLDVDFTVPTAIVLGAEGYGLRPLVRRSCDLAVAIPMVGTLGSLNVAAAGAILLYEAMRQRRAAGRPAAEEER